MVSWLRGKAGAAGGEGRCPGYGERRPRGSPGGVVTSAWEHSVSWGASWYKFAVGERCDDGDSRSGLLIEGCLILRGRRVSY